MGEITTNQPGEDFCLHVTSAPWGAQRSQRWGNLNVACVFVAKILWPLHKHFSAMKKLISCSCCRPSSYRRKQLSYKPMRRMYSYPVRTSMYEDFSWKSRKKPSYGYPRQSGWVCTNSCISFRFCSRTVFAWRSSHQLRFAFQPSSKERKETTGKKNMNVQIIVHCPSEHPLCKTSRKTPHPHKHWGELFVFFLLHCL